MMKIPFPAGIRDAVAGSRPRRNRWFADSALEEAVSSELVSEARIPGISSIRGSAARERQQKRALDQGFTSQFPTHPNREFFSAMQGI
jgi:hypothetical protein